MKANQKYKDFKSDENAAIGMIIMGALILVLSIIIIPVFYRIASSTDTTSIDSDFQTSLGDISGYSNVSTPAANATDDIISIGNSVMSLNPLAALVAVAGGIIGILLSVLSPKIFAGAGI